MTMRVLKTCLILLFLIASCPVNNYSGATVQEQINQRLKARIWELKEKYPPDDYKWMYEHSKSLK